MSLGKSQRARGSNRGGCGGGYEHTDPDYQDHRLQRQVSEYLSLQSHDHRQMYLDGLSKFEAQQVVQAVKERERKLR